MFGYGSCLRAPQKDVLCQVFPNFLRWALASAAPANPSNPVRTSYLATFCVSLMKRSSFKSRTRTGNFAGPWWVTNTRKSSHKYLYTKPPKIFSASPLSTDTGTKFSALIMLWTYQISWRSLKILRVLSEISMIGQSATMRHGWNLLSRLATLANHQLTLIRYWFI